MSGTYVSNGTPGKVYVQNLVFDDNTITPSANIGNNNISVTTDDGNNVVVNKLNITRDSVNTAVIMSTLNDDDHMVLRSGNGNIYLGTVDNNVKSTTLSLVGDRLEADNNITGNIKLLSGTTGTTNIDNTFYVKNGNIGIGKSAPTTKLDVVGSIKLTGTLLKTDGTPYVIDTWGKNSNDLYYSDGNAIIGSNGTPSGRFDIVSSTGRGLLVTGDVGSGGAQASFTGSSNTMLLRSSNSSSGNYVFSIEKSDNSSVFRVGNDGLVGIGNNAPSYGLDVAVSARIDHSLVVGGTGLSVSVDGESVKLVGTSSCYVGLYPDSPSSRKGYFGYDEGVLKFDSESSSRHFTFSGGNVGLKTLTPDYHLTINAGSTDSSLGVGNDHAFGIVGSNDQEALWMGYDAVVDAGYFNVSNADGAVPLLLQNLGGSVGIGSSSPLGRLDVRKGTAGSSGWEAASFGAETSANDLLVIGNYNNRAVIAGKNATMNEDANLVLAPTGGNVGVGAMSPNYKLDVNGNVNFSGTLYQDGNAVALSSFYESGGNVYLNSGNFGIGNSSPSYDIDVAGDINYTGNLYKNGTLVSAGSGLWTANGSDIYFSGGNVGVGTTSPFSSSNLLGLHISKSYHSALVLGEPTNSTYGGIIQTSDERHRVFIGANIYDDPIDSWTSTTANKGYAGINCLADANDWGSSIQFWVSDTNHTNEASLQVRMTINDDGNVGIGTTTPYAKLHIQGLGPSSAPSLAHSVRTLITSTSVTANQSSGTALSGYNSLYATGAIVTSGYIISHGTTSFSDRRIKANIVDVEDDICLQKLRLIKPKQYTYQDTIEKGTAPVWGFIAQEVDSVMDYAVEKMEKAIPNVYKLASVSQDGFVLTFDESVSLETNVKLQLKTFVSEEHDVTVSEVLSSTSVRLTEPLTEEHHTGIVDGESINGKVFVYGQWVDDFHVLKKDAIFTVAVAALQEVDRRQVADNERILELEGDVTIMQTELDTTRAELDTTRTELADTKAQMESILARLTALENA